MHFYIGEYKPRTHVILQQKSRDEMSKETAGYDLGIGGVRLETGVLVMIFQKETKDFGIGHRENLSM